MEKEEKSSSMMRMMMMNLKWGRSVFLSFSSLEASKKDETFRQVE
tara:strand:+ start:986 stop:1120 length:135 start_codon:yes stop_codon:yes gene_type:complete